MGIYFLHVEHQLGGILKLSIVLIKDVDCKLQTPNLANLNIIMRVIEKLLGSLST